MPNPNDPEQAECGVCHDSGLIPGTDRLCHCTGVGRLYGNPARLPFPETTMDPRMLKIMGSTTGRITAEQRIIRRVLDVWERNGGWIPGGAYKELAEALGVDVSRLSHYDRENSHRVGPPNHRFAFLLAPIDGAPVNGACGIWVDGERCTKTPEEHIR